MTLQKDDPAYKDNPGGAYEEAFKIVKTEYDAGSDGKTGRWARDKAQDMEQGQLPDKIIYKEFITLDVSEKNSFLKLSILLPTSRPLLFIGEMAFSLIH